MKICRGAGFNALLQPLRPGGRAVAVVRPGRCVSGRTMEQFGLDDLLSVLCDKLYLTEK